MSPAKWLALFLMVRATSFATGCSNDHDAGTLGGKCIQSCGEPHCDDGLVCGLPEGAYDDPDNEVCMTAPPTPSANGGDLGEENCSGPEDSPLCPAGVPAYECLNPLTTLGPCTYASSTSYSTTYCCPYGPAAVDASADAIDGAVDIDASIEDASTSDAAADANDE